MSYRPRLLFALLFVAAAGGAVPAAAEIVKREPAIGKLKLGQRVLVDDGSCPAGQILQLTGGNHVAAGGQGNVVRQRRCIPRR